MIVRLKGIKKARAKGRVYYYDRITGKPIESEYGTQAFLTEVNTLRTNARTKDAAENLKGKLGGLILAFKISPEWEALAPRTRADYQKIFDWLDEEKMREAAVAEIEPVHVLRLRDRAFRKKKRRFANYVVQLLSRLFTWGQPRQWNTSNPAAGVEKIARPRGTPKVNRRWHPEEYTAVMAAAEPHLKLPIGLAYFTGLREGDVIRLTWEAYRNGSIALTLGKGDIPHRVHAATELRNLLAEAKAANSKRKVQSTTIVTGKRGRAYEGESGFRANFFKLIRKLKEEEKVAPGLTFHGLRTTLMTELAEAGEDTFGIRSVSGQKSDASVKPYIEEANRTVRGKAAVTRLERHRKRTSKQ